MDYSLSPAKGVSIAAAVAGFDNVWFSVFNDKSQRRSHDESFFADFGTTVHPVPVADVWDLAPFLATTHEAIWYVNIPSVAAALQLRYDTVQDHNSNNSLQQLLLQHLLKVLRCASIVRPVMIFLECYGEGADAGALFIPAVFSFASLFGYTTVFDTFNLGRLAPCSRARKVLILSRCPRAPSSGDVQVDRAMLASAKPELFYNNSITGRAVLCPHGPSFPLIEVPAHVADTLSLPYNTPDLHSTVYDRCPLDHAPPLSPFYSSDHVHRAPPWPGFWYLRFGAKYWYPPRAIARLLTVPDQYSVPELNSSSFVLFVSGSAPAMALRYLFFATQTCEVPIPCVHQILAGCCTSDATSGHHCGRAL